MYITHTQNQIFEAAHSLSSKSFEKTLTWIKYKFSR